MNKTAIKVQYLYQSYSNNLLEFKLKANVDRKQMSIEELEAFEKLFQKASMSNAVLVHFLNTCKQSETVNKLNNLKTTSHGK